MYAVNLMEVSKSIAAREGHGKEDVLEQDYDRSLGQHGDLRHGRVPLVMKLTLSLGPPLRQKGSKLLPTGKESPVREKRSTERR